ncbi:MAG: ABC transporter ATP-binding protein [Candidatus Helarchaeota archaeon]
MVKNIIMLENVSKSYKIHSHLIEVLKNINLEVVEGEFLVISGSNGSGKTTLFNMIAGLDKPNSGEITVLGKKYAILNEERMNLYRALNMGLMLQGFDLITSFTARENIELPLHLLKFEKDRILKKTLRLLKLVDLTAKADRLPSQLSNGEQRRVSFARALVNDPPIVLADEPIANLDVENSNKILSLFKDLKSKKKTVIVMTQNPQILKIASRIVYLHNGELTKDKEVSDLNTLF